MTFIVLGPQISPQNVKLTEGNESCVTLEWESVEFSNGDIAGYKVRNVC